VKNGRRLRRGEGGKGKGVARSGGAGRAQGGVREVARGTRGRVGKGGMCLRAWVLLGCRFWIDLLRLDEERRAEGGSGDEEGSGI
jgi:hypothetical protein